MSRHTDVPWEARTPSDTPTHVVKIYQDAEGRRCTAFVAVCSATTLDNAANAEFIVRACNSHDDLLAALKEAIATIKVFHGKPAWDIYERCAPEMQRFKAAIAKAEGVPCSK